MLSPIVGCVALNFVQMGVNCPSLYPKLVSGIQLIDNWGGGDTGAWECCNCVTIAGLLFPEFVPVMSTVSYIEIELQRYN